MQMSPLSRRGPRTNISRRCTVAASAVMLAIMALSGCSSETEDIAEAEPETISIPLTQTLLREPLISAVLPGQLDKNVEISVRSESENSETPPTPSSSSKQQRDSVRFTSRGMLVRQPATDDARRVTGFKLLVPASGDFELQLDWGIRHLDPPTGKFGSHGLAMRFPLRNSETEVVVFGCMSMPGFERCLVKRVNQRDMGRVVDEVSPVDFSSGTWTVTRTGSNISLRVNSDDGALIVEDSAEIGNGTLEATEIWCTRLARGNGRAEIELRNVSMTAGHLFPTQPESGSIMKWIQTGFAVLVVVLLLFTYRARQ